MQPGPMRPSTEMSLLFNVNPECISNTVAVEGHLRASSIVWFKKKLAEYTRPDESSSVVLSRAILSTRDRMAKRWSIGCTDRMQTISLIVLMAWWSHSILSISLYFLLRCSTFSWMHTIVIGLVWVSEKCPPWGPRLLFDAFKLAERQNLKVPS